MKYLIRTLAYLFFPALFTLMLYAIRVNGGNDAINTGVFATSYLGVSSNSTHAPTATDTTLAGLITTPSGMACTAATIAHTTGVNQSKASVTFSNTTGSPITVYLVGLFSNSACTSGMISEDYAIPPSGTGLTCPASGTCTIGLTENY